MKLKTLFKTIFEKQSFPWLFLCAFVVVLFLIYTTIFIANISTAYIDYGDIFPPSNWVKGDYLLIAFFSIICCIILKIMLKKKIKIFVTLICAILLPFLCYNLNYNAFKNDSPLYPLVDKGGALHFMLLKGDKYKEYYDKIFSERTNHAELDNIFTNHTVFDTVYIDTTGIGPGLDSITYEYINSKNFLKLWLDTEQTQYNKIKLTITLQNQNFIDQLLFYTTDSSGQKEPIKYTVIDDKNIFIELDAKSIERFYNSAKNGTFTITFEYDYELNNQ